jgi:RNA polymerase sigma-70 factor (ECF subfamily)
MADAPAPDRPSTRPTFIDRLKAGDPSAWKQLVENYRPLVLHWAKRLGAPAPEDREDVFQDVLKVTVKKITTFKLRPRPGSFRKWLKRITKMVWLERLKWAPPGTRAPGGTDATMWFNEIPDPAAGDEGPADEDPPHLVAEVNRRAVIRVLDEFSDRDQAVFWRLTRDDRGPKEVADEFGLKVPHVRKIKSRIYHRVHEELGDCLPGQAASPDA